ncbi:MAG: AbrB/MazE/SpoVT family DNA-binding domain-containing protein [Nanoarchaeota archaeon]|nr:AbrB/MazE/SpoVT family DNA-binding domain-containing protein [Nanoarchaeota archaeon]
MNIDVTRLSSKGQIVIPREMRQQFSNGEKLIIIQDNDQLILKKASAFRKNLEEDLIFAKRTEEAWRRYDAGKFISMDSDKFLEKINKW